MVTEGPQVVRQVDDAHRRAKRDLDARRAEAERLDERSRGLEDRREQALRRLARLFLPELSRPAIESTFEGVRAPLLAILAEEDAKRAEHREQLDRAEAEAGANESDRADVARKLGEAIVRRDGLETKWKENLGANADHRERSRVAREAGERLARDQARSDELAREAAEKLPAFEKSRLFRYLRDRGFGTPEYRSTGWVRSMDRKVADLIDFPKALDGYEFLKKAPGLVAEEVARRREAFDELKGQVDAIEEAEADAIGLTPARAGCSTLERERDRLDAEVARLRGRAETLRGALAALDRPDDEFHGRALDRLREFLAEARFDTLRARARQVAGTEDNALVEELTGLDAEAHSLEARRADAGANIRAAERVEEGLKKIIHKFTRAGFDSDESYFSGLDVGREIARFEDGTIDAEGLWRSIESHQRTRPRPVEKPAPASGGVVYGEIIGPGPATGYAPAPGTSPHWESNSPASPSVASGPSTPAFEPAPPPPPPPPDPPASDGGEFTTVEGY